MIISISRQEVEAGSIAPILSRLLQLTDSRDNVFGYHASVILSFDGYDREPQELFEIPELRAFIRALTAEWPHWLWFLKRGTNSIPLLFSLLCEVQVVPGQQGYEAEFADGNELVAVLDDLLERANVMYSCYGISESQATVCAESAVWDLFDGFV